MNGTDGSYLLDSYGYQSTCSGKKTEQYLDREKMF